MPPRSRRNVIFGKVSYPLSSLELKSQSQAHIPSLLHIAKINIPKDNTTEHEIRYGSQKHLGLDNNATHLVELTDVHSSGSHNYQNMQRY
ncbi:uncharacterized protein RSE6_00667 [Rhynchosporium secalis]|uniref:Uncharacterized protein n=1 Tax=Rhynchosporium secalis TaxID=38038 RepID=A0A1E1LVW3_RHYSE|nr:uncharacterized protein RSE6_00667 [Rhynchosporium secalis]